MARAYKALAAIAQKDPRQLPRYKSGRSGEVFSRMTAASNLDFFRDRSVPIETRLPQAITFFESSNQLLKLYFAAFVKKAVTDSELVELMGAQFRATAVVVRLVDEFLPTLDKNDPTYQIRMEGLEKMKRGLATLVASGLQGLTETYRVDGRGRLLGYMEETFPEIVPHLPPGSRTEVLIRLESMTKDSRLKELQPRLDQLRVRVQSAVESAKRTQPLTEDDKPALQKLGVYAPS